MHSTCLLVNYTTLVNISKEDRHWICIVNVQYKFISDNQGSFILPAWAYKTLQTASYRHWHYRISPRQVKLRLNVKNCFHLYSMEHYFKYRATMVIYSTMKWPSTARCHDSEQHMWNGILSNHACDSGAVSVIIHIEFSIGKMDFNTKTSHEFSHRLLYWST
jgi:hypothetical protein